MKILIKVSGDLQNDSTFFEWLRSISKPSDNLYVLCGGGTAISQVLKEHGITSEFGPSGREISTEEGRQLALDVLKEQKTSLKKTLKKLKINASVFIPIIKVDNEFFHLNGDTLATALYPNFDTIFIVTKKGRVKLFPKEFSKIEIVYL